MAEKLSIVRETGGLVAGDDIYVTRDGRLVGEDDPEAHSLVASKGRPIPEKLVARYGIKATGKAPAKEPEPVAAEENLAQSFTSHRPSGAERPAVEVKKMDISTGRRGR